MCFLLSTRLHPLYFLTADWLILPKVCLTPCVWPQTSGNNLLSSVSSWVFVSVFALHVLQDGLLTLYLLNRWSCFITARLTVSKTKTARKKRLQSFSKAALFTFFLLSGMIIFTYLKPKLKHLNQSEADEGFSADSEADGRGQTAAESSSHPVFLFRVVGGGVSFFRRG